MKARIIVTTDSGTVYTGEVELQASTGSQGTKKVRVQSPKARMPDVPEIDFVLPVRPFVKKHSGSMSGPKRLTLLIARIADGKTDARVDRSQIVRLWNKMTALMGGRFNPAYDTRARDNGWISSPEPGCYVLRPTWREIFSA